MISFKQFFKEALQMINGKLGYAPRDAKERMAKFRDDMLAGSESGSDENITKKITLSSPTGPSRKFWIKQNGEFKDVPFGKYHQDIEKGGASRGYYRAYTNPYEGVRALFCENRVVDPQLLCDLRKISIGVTNKNILTDGVDKIIIVNRSGTKVHTYSKELAGNKQTQTQPDPGVVDLSGEM